MSRLYGAGSGWHLLRGVCSKLDRIIDICSKARAENFSSVEAEVVAHLNL